MKNQFGSVLIVLSYIIWNVWRHGWLISNEINIKGTNMFTKEDCWSNQESSLCFLCIARLDLVCYYILLIMILARTVFKYSYQFQISIFVIVERKRIPSLTHGYPHILVEVYVKNSYPVAISVTNAVIQVVVLPVLEPLLSLVHVVRPSELFVVVCSTSSLLRIAVTFPA